MYKGGDVDRWSALMQGKVVPEESPWFVRIGTKTSESGGAYRPGSGIALPPSFRWVLIARHSWDDAEQNPANLVVIKTEFKNDANYATADAIGIEKRVIPGFGDIAAVRLIHPIEIAEDLVKKMPAFNWHYDPQLSDTTVHQGFGQWDNLVLRRAQGDINTRVPHKDYKEAKVFLSIMDDGMMEGGDSGGPVYVDGQIVGVNAGGWVGTQRGVWSPFVQEAKLREELENLPDGIKVVHGNNGSTVTYKTNQEL
jgi:hypothetical protein